MDDLAAIAQIVSAPLVTLKSEQHGKPNRVFLAKPNWIILGCSFNKRRLGRDEAGFTYNTRREIAQLYCILFSPGNRDYVGRNEFLRLTLCEPNTFSFDGRYPQLWKVFFNLDSLAQDPATEPATRSNQYSGWTYSRNQNN